MSVNKSTIWGNLNQIQLFNWGWGCLGKATRWVILLFNVWKFTHPIIGLMARLIKGGWEKFIALLKQHKWLEIWCIQWWGNWLLSAMSNFQLCLFNACVAKQLNVWVRWFCILYLSKKANFGEKTMWCFHCAHDLALKGLARNWWKFQLTQRGLSSSSFFFS